MLQRRDYLPLFALFRYNYFVPDILKIRMYGVPKYCIESKRLETVECFFQQFEISVAYVRLSI